MIVSACEYDPQDTSTVDLSHCAGQPGTLGFGYYADVDPVGGSTYYGTEGDDVAILVGYPVTFHGLGGDDLVCIVDTGLDLGTGEVTVYGGEGDDTILNLAGWPASIDEGPGQRPDIVVVNTDDQRADSMDLLPLVSSRTDWRKFPNSYVHEPQCCPSRATFFTGQYGFNNGVTSLRDGGDLDQSLTVATMLDAAGYRTQSVGKYMNGYPYGPLVSPPGWDDFSCCFGKHPDVPVQPNGKPVGYPYYNYRFWSDGEWSEHLEGPDDYSTDVYFAEAREFIQASAPTDPLYMYIAPLAPHSPWYSASRHDGVCDALDFSPSPNFNATDTVGEPPWMAAATLESSDWSGVRRTTCEMLAAVDEGVISVLDELEAAGRLYNTYVFFTSDNGYMFGEHRMTGKGALYEESAAVPLWVLGPDVAPGTDDRLTSNIDVVPTVLDLAGVAPPAGFLDGTSYADNLRGTDTSPDPPGVLLFGCRTLRAVSTDCGGYDEPMNTAWGLRTADHKYIRSEDGYEQLFDLPTDPYELTNLAPDPLNAALLQQHRDLAIAMRGFDTYLHGIIRRDDTAALAAGIEVSLHDGSGWNYSTTTGPGGDFTFFDLPPGSYPARFVDPSGSLVTEYYEDQTVEVLADPVVISSSDSLQIYARLAPS